MSFAVSAIPLIVHYVLQIIIAQHVYCGSENHGNCQWSLQGTK